jgi:soluble lytic murein transglycosylase
MWRCGLVLVIGAALAVAAPAVAEPRKATPAAYEPGGDNRAYSQAIARAARRYAVPESLVWAVIRAESGFDPRAVSRKGARGLMQLMPRTAAILGVRNPLDPYQNIDGGVRHLRALIDRFRNNLLLAVAAYNAGEKAVVEYGGVPPFRETQEYVSRVMRFYSMSVIVIDLPQGVHVIERDGTIVYTNVVPDGRTYRTGG